MPALLELRVQICPMQQLWTGVSTSLLSIALARNSFGGLGPSCTFASLVLQRQGFRGWCNMLEILVQGLGPLAVHWSPNLTKFKCTAPFDVTFVIVVVFVSGPLAVKMPLETM